MEMKVEMEVELERDVEIKVRVSDGNRCVEGDRRGGRDVGEIQSLVEMFSSSESEF